MKSWKLFALIGMVVLIAGCVSLRPPANPNLKIKYLSWQERQKRLSNVRFFVAKGAFSIREMDKKPVLANYRWVQNNRPLYRIRVFSPLNLFQVTILGHPGAVTLWKGPKKYIRARTPEALIKREMGWTLPIRNLFYWIRGVIAPGHKQMTYDKYGHLVTLRQDGWLIRFSHYTTVKGYDLPELVILQRPRVSVRLVIKEWVLTTKDLPVQP